jgi:hypothetical protein
MPFSLQDAAVTAAAGTAAAVFLYRMFGTRASRSSKPSCASCSSGNPCAPTPGETGAPVVHRLVLVNGSSGSGRPGEGSRAGGGSGGAQSPGLH